MAEETGDFIGKIRNALSNTYVHIAILAAVSFYIFFWTLGEGSLSHPDEAKYAEVSKQILKTGEWIALQFNHMPFLGKPPLYFWLTAITYKFFGISEFTARFWSAAFAVGIVLLTYLMGKELFDRRTGFISAIVLLATPQFTNLWSYSNTHSGRAVAQDTMVIFFILLSMLSFWIGRERGRYLILLGISMGLGVMSKSAVGLIPLFVIFPFMIFTREFGILRNKNLYGGVLAFLLIVLPWHILMLAEMGSDFFSKFVMKNVVSRAATGIGMAPSSDFFYIDVLKYGFYPWSIFILFAVLYIIKDAFEKKKSADVLLLSWTVVVFSIFTYSQFKTEHYIIPIYPVLALCTARFFEEFIKGKKDGLVFGGMFIGIALWASLISEIKYDQGAGITFDLNSMNVDFVRGLVISASVLFAYGAAGRLGERYAGVKKSISIVAIGIILASAIHAPPVNDFSHITAKISPVMKQVSDEKAVLMLYKLPHLYTSTVFYSDRQVWNLPGGETDKGYVLKYLNFTETAFAMMKLADYAELSSRKHRALAGYGDVILITNNDTVGPDKPVQIDRLVKNRLFYTDAQGYIFVKEFTTKNAPKGFYLDFTSALLESRTMTTKYPVVTVTPAWTSTGNDSKITIEISVNGGKTWTDAENGRPVEFEYSKENKHLTYRASRKNDAGKLPELRGITLTYSERVQASAEIIEDLNFSKNRLERGDTVRARYVVKNTGDVTLEGYLDITDSSNRRIFSNYPKVTYEVHPGETAAYEHIFTVGRGAPKGEFKVWMQMSEKNLERWMAAVNEEGKRHETIIEIL